jgi:hypothetical protein
MDFETFLLLVNARVINARLDAEEQNKRFNRKEALYQALLYVTNNCKLDAEYNQAIVRLLMTYNSTKTNYGVSQIEYHFDSYMVMLFGRAYIPNDGAKLPEHILADFESSIARGVIVG